MADSERDFVLWPFEGTLSQLVGGPFLAIGEVYPRAMYAVALCDDDLPAPRVHVAKTKASAREEALRMLADVKWMKQSGVRALGLDAAADDEDAFDALITALAMSRLEMLGRLEESRFADPTCEGDIIGLGALDFDARVIVVNGRGETRSPRNRRLAATDNPGSGSPPPGRFEFVD